MTKTYDRPAPPGNGPCPFEWCCKRPAYAWYILADHAGSLRRHIYSFPSPRRTSGLIYPMTTRTQKASSGLCSTVLSSPIASVASKTVTTSASSSFSGTTTSIATLVWACLLRPWCTLGRFQPLWQHARLCSMPPIRRTRTASSGDRPNPYRCPRRCGSTSRSTPTQRQTRIVTKFPCRVLKLPDTRRPPRRKDTCSDLSPFARSRYTLSV